MFKKSKNDKTPPPPCAPSLEEVLSDLETFHLDVTKQYPSASSQKPPTELEASWNALEQFTVDLKCLEAVHSDIERYKTDLDSHKLKITTGAKKLREQIDEQQNLIKAALDMEPNDLEHYKSELECHKLKTTTEPRNIKKEEDEQQELIKAAVE